MEDLSTQLPEQLSPSRLKDFDQCPRLFYYKTIEKLPSPATAATTKGTLAHYAMEKIFDHPRDERIAAVAVPYVRVKWAELSLKDAYANVVAEGEVKVALMLSEAEGLVEKWFSVERPDRFDPVGREMWVHGEIGGCKIRGVIDRLDEVPVGGEKVTYVSDYKGLALDTPLATPDGWTTMGVVEVGDKLFGADGQPCTVTATSSVHHRPCYRLTFVDGSDIVCDNVHLWAVRWRIGKKWHSAVLSTEDLIERWNDKRYTVIIPSAAPLETPETDLPLDPYLLGCWLGDGTAKNGDITVGHQDVAQFVGSLVNMGENVRVHTTEFARTAPVHTLMARTRADIDGAPSLGVRLRETGLLRNKHVPAEYLRGSITQRLALLQGLMDTDGHWNSLRHQAVFVNTNEQIIQSVYELVCSLGGRANIFRVEPKKETHAVAWKLMFTPNNFMPFRLARKAKHCRLRSSRSWRRNIRSIEPIESVPTRCVEVDSPDSLYLAGRQMVPTHNSGAIPREPYVKDAFFAMDIYAELVEQQEHKTPRFLRLVYVKNGRRDDVIKREVTPATRVAIRTKVEGLWNDIQAAAEKGEFAPRTSRLCDWCSFRDICPAWAEERPF